MYSPLRHREQCRVLSRIKEFKNQKRDCFDFVESDGPIDETMKLAMKIDLKANFNIKLHIIRDSSCK